MGTVSLVCHGSFNKTLSGLKKNLGRDWRFILEKYAEQGLQALSSNTPVDTGKTASSWSYKITEDNNGVSIVWENSNIIDGWANVALLIQYGHATRNGGYVVGRDYINPSIQPIFDKMAEAAWKEVNNV